MSEGINTKSYLHSKGQDVFAEELRDRLVTKMRELNVTNVKLIRDADAVSCVAVEPPEAAGPLNECMTNYVRQYDDVNQELILHAAYAAASFLMLVEYPDPIPGWSVGSRDIYHPNIQITAENTSPALFTYMIPYAEAVHNAGHGDA